MLNAEPYVNYIFHVDDTNNLTLTQKFQVKNYKTENWCLVDKADGQQV